MAGQFGSDGAKHGSRSSHSSGNFEGEAAGGLFAVIAVFNDVQEMQECCFCPLTPNSLLTISVIADLTSNPLITAESTEAGVIKILGFSSFIDHLAEGLHGMDQPYRVDGQQSGGFHGAVGFAPGGRGVLAFQNRRR